MIEDNDLCPLEGEVRCSRCGVGFGRLTVAWVEGETILCQVCHQSDLVVKALVGEADAMLEAGEEKT